MKIHIVQKGDTLWELSKKYGVDFEQLKQLNSQLSSPDMIMPGMKVKIPSSSKAVQKEGMMPKEMQQPIKHPYKDTSPKPLPVIKEDDKEKPKPIKPKMPMKPHKEMPMKPQPQMPMPMQPIIQMPIMEQELQNYTTINIPEMPTYHAPKEKPVKEKMKPMPLPQPQPMHMVPLCCHVINPYCPPGPHDFFPVMGTFAGGPVPMHNPMHNPMYGQMHHENKVQPSMYNHMMESSSNMEMPVNPYKAGAKDCGCKGKAAYPPHHMGGYQMNQPPAYGFNDYNYQQGFVPQNYPPNFTNAPTNGSPYPTPPGFYREDEDETQGE